MLEFDKRRNMLIQSKYRYGLQDVVEPNLYRELFTYGDPSNDWLYQMNPAFGTYEQKLYAVSDPTDWNLEQVLWDATHLYAPYAVDKAIPPLLYTPEDAAEVGEYKSILQDYIQESIAKFVTGALDIDKDWAAYLGELDQIGANRMVEIVQKSYDALY